MKLLGKSYLRLLSYAIFDKDDTLLAVKILFFTLKGLQMYIVDTSTSRCSAIHYKHSSVSFLISCQL